VRENERNDEDHGKVCEEEKARRMLGVNRETPDYL
jgi:hypothetical protein